MAKFFYNYGCVVQIVLRCGIAFSTAFRCRIRNFGTIVLILLSFGVFFSSPFLQTSYAAETGSLTPFEFGAVGNGIADDTASLQKALDAAVGKKLVLEGTFLCKTDGLKIPSGTTLIGRGKARIVRGFDTGKSGSRVLASAVPAGGEKTIHDIHIANITFDGNGAKFGKHPFDLLFMSTLPTRNITIRSCVFRDVVGYHAIDVNRCDNVRIVGCRFEGWKNFNPASSEWANDKREAIQLDGFKVEDAANRNKNILVENCWFGRSENFGPWPVAVGNHGWFDSAETCKNITIRNNVFDSLTYYPVTCLAWHNVLIENNVFKNCANGVSVFARNNSKNGVFAVPKKVKIVGNRFERKSKDSSSTALMVWISSGRDVSSGQLEQAVPSGVLFSRNTVANFHHGASIITGKDINISGNTFENVDSIELFICRDVRFSNNKMTNSGNVHVNSAYKGYTSSAAMNSHYEMSGNAFLAPRGNCILFSGTNSHVSVSDNVIHDRKQQHKVNSLIQIGKDNKNVMLKKNEVRP